MSSAWKKAKRVSGGISKVESKCLDFESFPNLSAFMGGVLTADEKGLELAPHTLTVWVEGDSLAYCLQSKEEANKVFGGVDTLYGAIDKIEETLAKEQFSVRKAKR